MEIPLTREDNRCGGSNEAKRPLPRILSQNLCHTLIDREMGYIRQRCNSKYKPTSECFLQNFYKSITPTITVQNVSRRLGYIRKFTPDGRYLVCFTADQRSIDIFEFHGCGRAAGLLKHQTKEVITAADKSEESVQIRQNIFSTLFSLRWSIPLIPPEDLGTSHLNREFSIFLENGRLVLLAAMSLGHENPPYALYRQYGDLHDDYELFSYTFFLVDLQRGRILDKFRYNCDFILLSHNHGVSAYGKKIAILSKFRQAIDIYEVINDKIVRLYEIGPFSCKIDELRFREVPEYASNNRGRPLRSSNRTPAFVLSHLKQNILSYIYREIMEIESQKMRQMKLTEFYKNTKVYYEMIISKMELMDESNILLRYEEPNAIVSDDAFKLYVFYCLKLKRVYRVYQKNSTELLHVLRDFCENFRNVRSLQTNRASSSPSNNVYLRSAFTSAINSIQGGQEEAALRFLPTLPISTQSYQTSFYLDFNLFQYDDRVISALERPKATLTEPIRFSDRETNITKFRLFLETSRMETRNIPDLRELSAFVFHPYEPFIISVQKIGSRYIVNFHLYNSATIVAK